MTARHLSHPGYGVILASMSTNFNQPVLQVDRLDVRYGNFQAVKQVSFQVKPGEIFGLLGPNGAGKTSTLSAVEGLLTPTAGTITVAGYDSQRQALYARASMGVQLQSTSFQPELTITEIIRLYAGIHGVTLNKDHISSIARRYQTAGRRRQTLRPALRRTTTTRVPRDSHHP